MTLPATVAAGNSGHVSHHNEIHDALLNAGFIVVSAHAVLGAEKVLGTDVIVRGTAAARPAASINGIIYVETDGSKIIWRDNGSTWDEIGRGETGIRLAQLAEKNHSSLAGVGTDDHHAKSHLHNGADGSGSVAHSSLTGIGPNDHHSQSHGPGDHTGTSDERALYMGVSGTISATMADAADFLVVVPFNMTLKRLKVSRKTHGSAASVVQVRRSTDLGATYANAFGSATFGATALVATADPADLDVDEGDVLNFSVSTGGGTNLLVEAIGKAR